MGIQPVCFEIQEEFLVQVTEDGSPPPCEDQQPDISIKEDVT